MNEYLFDLAVCSVSATKSLQTEAKELPFIARCHRQIEFEFSRSNTRHIVRDMSKLVMGSAENKLFVASHWGEREAAVLEQCSEIARCCTGRVYFCFVSHPQDWGDKPVLPALHEWIMGGWTAVTPAPRA